MSKETTESPISLNAKLNLWGEDGRVQFEKDKEAARAYFIQVVNPRTQFFHDLEEKLEFLFDNGYYDQTIWDQYEFAAVKELYKAVYSHKHRFESYFSALKFFDQYAMKSFDGSVWLERFEDRVVANALLLGNGDIEKAQYIAEEIITGRLQPATPTFSNAGKVARGEFVSCFLLRIEDNMESIGRGINSALQLSKRGGGVALLLTNIREQGAPIKGIEDASSGIIPVMKLLEDSFSYANQLGTRQGAGAVYLNAHHPDIMRFLDTKRENADEKVRIKTLSTGVVVPDILFELAKNDEDMYLFSPHDVQKVYGKPFADISVTEKYRAMVDDPRIRKYKPQHGSHVVKAREFFTILAELQFESGYPYILFEDTANRAHAAYPDQRINMSNLCVEILQGNYASEFNDDLSYSTVGRDISCNLASLNIAKVMEGGNLRQSVETAVNALTSVSDITSMDSVPSVVNGNDKSHSIGLGQMNLASFFLKEGMRYGDTDAIDFTNIYFMTVAYEAYRASMRIAKRVGKAFDGFEKSKYADPAYLTEKYADASMVTPNENTKEIFEKYGIEIPTSADWAALAKLIAEYGIYNSYLQAVPPTGSISYVNNSSSSIHPHVDAVETRKEGRTGRVYYPQPYVTNENFSLVENSYQVGWKRLIDVYATAQRHIDQSLSMTLYFNDTDTTATINKAQIYAWRSGIKTIYYSRIRQSTLAGTEATECVSCSL